MIFSGIISDNSMKLFCISKETVAALYSKNAVRGTTPPHHVLFCGLPNTTNFSLLPTPPRTPLFYFPFGLKLYSTILSTKMYFTYFPPILKYSKNFLPAIFQQ